jgi:hypothetical protein
MLVPLSTTLTRIVCGHASQDKGAAAIFDGLIELGQEPVEGTGENGSVASVGKEGSRSLVADVDGNLNAGGCHGRASILVG